MQLPPRVVNVVCADELEFKGWFHDKKKINNLQLISYQFAQTDEKWASRERTCEMKIEKTHIAWKYSLLLSP